MAVSFLIFLFKNIIFIFCQKDVKNYNLFFDRAKIYMADICHAEKLALKISVPKK